MFPFWDTVIEPLLRASNARRVVEIGALRGETTVRALDALGVEAELHVIDPLPEFDPVEHERAFAGRYVFHRDLSLNVLPGAPAFDLALIDGDHNWYTVYNELQLLRTTARREGRHLPLLVLHDVGWPYGRRDLYYEPSQIPAEFRQPYGRRGMAPGRAELFRGGGFNSTLNNAITEGGPRNGVLTALDDFVAEHDEPLRQLMIPIYFGLAIVAEEVALEANAELVAVLDHLDSREGKQMLLELSEKIRLDEGVQVHNFLRVRLEKMGRARDRHLELLRAALLDEHYLENELRIEYLLDCALNGREPLPEKLRAPMAQMRPESRRLTQARRAGASSSDELVPSGYFPFSSMGADRFVHLDRVLGEIRDQNVSGDLVECATGRGGGAVYLRAFLEAHEIPDRNVWVADPFRAAPDDRDVRPLAEGGVTDLLPDLNQVRDAFDRFGLLDDRTRFLQGRFEETLPDAPIGEIALLRIGATAGSNAAVVLQNLYARVVLGGYVVIEDASGECGAAVEGFRSSHGLTEQVARVGTSGMAWRKELDIVAGGRARDASESPAGRAPIPSAAAVDALDLSVVVVFYNMRREARRTLHSLSRSYQRGLDDTRYEVIVLENGSAEEDRLGEEFVRSFGPEFGYVDLSDDAQPSPTHALNVGISRARGNALALMIDGAHVLTPSVLRFGLAGLKTYAPAVVATQQWYVGPGQQPDMVDAGYDEASEDALFERIDWPHDGYRLFEIGHFIGERDWFDGIIESNCLFVQRSQLEQVGGFDDSFSTPGGGYANLELFERLASSPDITLVSILGEGSFHQVHGGTTTNDGVRDDRRSKVFSYGEQFQQLRGRLLHGPAKPVHYVGSLATNASRRTRSRRMVATAFSRTRAVHGPDGIPDAPAPVSDELKLAFIEAFWNGLAWRQAEWLGEAVNAAPTDLMVYQELLSVVRPEWVVLTGTNAGGRALFLASICDLLGEGGVVAIDNRPDVNAPDHARITYVEGSSYDEATFERVRGITGRTPRGLVILGARLATGQILREFGGYAPLVAIGSFLVVENTIVNGRPVWPGYGTGPAEAVRRILATNGDFVADTSWEKYALTFNPGGFLRRIS